MNYSSNGLQLTEYFEGCSLTAYQDAAGVWTIGYGHTIGVQPGDTCTQAQAEAWLEQDVAGAVATVNQFVTVPLTQGQFDALVDFVFNLGATNFESSTLLKLLNEGDYAGAADQFVRWDHCNGEENVGLLARRQAETAEFKGNPWQPAPQS